MLWKLRFTHWCEQDIEEAKKVTEILTELARECTFAGQESNSAAGPTLPKKMTSLFYRGPKKRNCTDFHYPLSFSFHTLLSLA